MKINEKVTEQVVEKTNLSKLEIWGLVLGLVAVVIASFTYRYGIFGHKKISGSPNIVSGLMAFVFTAILYWRGLIAFTNPKKVGKLISVIVNITIFSTMFSLIICAMEGGMNEIFAAVTLTICIMAVLFGMKGTAKLLMILSLLMLSIGALTNLDKAMGGWGFLYELLVFSSFYLQGIVNFSGVHDELKILYGKAVYTIKDAATESDKEIGEAREEAKKVAKEVAKEVAKTSTMV